jgi:hypothetical protein
MSTTTTAHAATLAARAAARARREGKCQHPDCAAPSTDELDGWRWCFGHLWWALSVKVSGRREGVAA